MLTQRSIKRHFSHKVFAINLFSAPSAFWLPQSPLASQEGPVIPFFRHMTRQERRHHISLNQDICLAPAMTSLFQRFLSVGVRCRIVWQQFQLIGIQFHHLTYRGHALQTDRRKPALLAVERLTNYSSILNVWFESAR